MFMPWMLATNMFARGLRLEPVCRDPSAVSIEQTAGCLKAREVGLFETLVSPSLAPVHTSTQARRLQTQALQAQALCHVQIYPASRRTRHLRHAHLLLPRQPQEPPPLPLPTLPRDRARSHRRRHPARQARAAFPPLDYSARGQLRHSVLGGGQTPWRGQGRGRAQDQGPRSVHRPSPRGQVRQQGRDDPQACRQEGQHHHSFCRPPIWTYCRSRAAPAQHHRSHQCYDRYRSEHQR
ncbi:hypothetical protein K456DRAFT_1154965 [Colletotrichum gloeosporioides 23]|nr:hypothetical protein K456DRAFT_1154965 [Colletotrichum gloeosporioides 23]